MEIRVIDKHWLHTMNSLPVGNVVVAVALVGVQEEKLIVQAVTQVDDTVD